MIKNISEMDPTFPNQDGKLMDLAMDVHRQAAALGKVLHKITRHQVTQLLRHINSYYSNLIEGHHTHPSDIERAVQKEYDTNSEKRHLQELSIAHIEVQQKMENLIAEHPDIQICDSDFITWIHKSFYELVPEEFRRIRDPKTGKDFLMSPGELRQRQVVVGRHVPVSSDTLPDFLKRFNNVYNPDKLHGTAKLIAIAASHHRLAWIHPFLDGNGRVCRLFSHAYMMKANIESHGLWTISRGLARNRDEYMQYLALADAPRQGDYDGRGNLSERNLGQFCTFYLNICLDQIEFMGELLDLDKLQDRIKGYVDLRSNKIISGDNELRPEAKYILVEVMLRGEISRGDAKRISGLNERTARSLVSQLEKEKLITSESHRGPIRFNIPPKVVGYYFPNLYPEGMI
ncbi:MAG TPA: Fic family protein [Balneolales bacterium]|nr:Fic family protein [Balneolales bacterium]